MVSNKNGYLCALVIWLYPYITGYITGYIIDKKNILKKFLGKKKYFVDFIK